MSVSLPSFALLFLLHSFNLQLYFHFLAPKAGGYHCYTKPIPWVFHLLCYTMHHIPLKGLFIRSRLFILFDLISNTFFGCRYHYNVADNRLRQHVDKGIEDGLYISCVASSANLWALIMDAGTGFSSQVYELSPAFLHKVGFLSPIFIFRLLLSKSSWMQ